MWQHTRSTWSRESWIYARSAYFQPSSCCAAPIRPSSWAVWRSTGCSCQSAGSASQTGLWGGKPGAPGPGASAAGRPRCRPPDRPPPEPGGCPGSGRSSRLGSAGCCRRCAGGAPAPAGAAAGRAPHRDRAPAPPPHARRGQACRGQRPPAPAPRGRTPGPGAAPPGQQLQLLIVHSFRLLQLQA